MARAAGPPTPAAGRGTNRPLAPTCIRYGRDCAHATAAKRPRLSIDCFTLPPAHTLATAQVYWQSYALHASRATAQCHRYPELSYDCLQAANSSVILAPTQLPHESDGWHGRPPSPTARGNLIHASKLTVRLASGLQAIWTGATSAPSGPRNKPPFDWKGEAVVTPTLIVELKLVGIAFGARYSLAALGIILIYSPLHSELMSC
jgi:hypothetical protein